MGILGGIELDMRNSGSINMNKNSKNVVLYASEDTQDYPPPPIHPFTKGSDIMGGQTEI